MKITLQVIDKNPYKKKSKKSKMNAIRYEITKNNLKHFHASIYKHNP